MQAEPYLNGLVLAREQQSNYLLVSSKANIPPRNHLYEPITAHSGNVSGELLGRMEHPIRPMMLTTATHVRAEHL